MFMSGISFGDTRRGAALLCFPLYCTAVYNTYFTVTDCRLWSCNMLPKNTKTII